MHRYWGDNYNQLLAIKVKYILVLMNKKYYEIWLRSYLFEQKYMVSFPVYVLWCSVAELSVPFFHGSETSHFGGGGSG